MIDKKKIDILEIHNRPHYINTLDKIKNIKKILYFHNDPLKMLGSTSVNDRLNLIKKNEKIIFNSNWSRDQFLKGLPNNNFITSKISVVHQSTSKTKIDFNKKQN